jgi:cobalt/nickel transport system ATP-binding protein
VSDAQTPVSAAQTQVSDARTPVFDLHDVSFVYGNDVVALRDVSFCVQRGERLALLGANGSGKSTLLKIMAGRVAPTGGEISAFGSPLAADLLRDGPAAHDFRRRVGIVFQSADAQLFTPTVRDEIAFGPLHLELPREEVLRRVADTLRMLGLDDLAERAPYNLSGGEKKKVALAAVLSINPEVLMFDEPAAGLDPRTQQWLLELLARLHGAGKTIVIATHRLDELERVADRALILAEDHTVAAIGPVAELLADRDLLLAANLIHVHAHYHGEVLHSHPHGHADDEALEVVEPAPHEHDHGAPVTHDDGAPASDDPAGL